MVPVISFVGISNSGKTTLIKKVIAYLKQKGYRVGAIKNDAHRFDIDHKGKDSWEMTAAGADTVVVSSQDKLAMIKILNEEPKINEIVDCLFQDVDIVIIEGCKKSNYPKIEIYRFNSPITPIENNLIALVNNVPEGESIALPDEYAQINIFHFADYMKISEFVEREICSQSGSINVNR